MHEIWYNDEWVSVTDPMRPICKIGCTLGNFAKKAPNLGQSFSGENGILKGPKLVLFIGIANSDLSESSRLIHGIDMFQGQ